MGLGILLVNEVTVVGTYQLYAILRGQFHQGLVRLLLQGERFAVGADAWVLHLMALQLEVIVVAEDALIPLHGLLGPLHVAFQHLGGHLSGYARRANYQSFVVCLEVCAVGTRAHIEAVNPRAAHQLDKVLVALVVLCQHNQVVTTLVALVFHLVGLRAARHVHLASEYGLKLGLALLTQLGVLLVAVVEELLDAEHIAVVGHGHASHAVGYGLVNQPLDAGLAVEDAVVCMYVKVNEVLHSGCSG